MGHADAMISVKSSSGDKNQKVSTQPQPQPRPHDSIGEMKRDGKERERERERERNIAAIFQSIGDEKSLLLFRLIGMGMGDGKKNDSGALLSQLIATRKQYYSRLSRLKKVGLITSHGRMYSLTSFGQIIYKVAYFSDIAYQYKWKLDALDMIKSTQREFPNNEFDTIANAVINNSEIKDLLK